jgi:hypothetical protein
MNEVKSSVAKHIQVKYHVIRECIHQGYVSLKYVASANNPSDVLTKALPYDAFSRHTRTLLNIPSHYQDLGHAVQTCQVLAKEYQAYKDSTKEFRSSSYFPT